MTLAMYLPAYLFRHLEGVHQMLQKPSRLGPGETSCLPNLHSQIPKSKKMQHNSQIIT